MYRLKSSLEDADEQLDVVRRENKNLAEEIKDLLDQLGDGGRSIHELDKQRRRLEVEKEELQGALEEAESSLEQEENKVETFFICILIGPVIGVEGCPGARPGEAGD